MADQADRSATELCESSCIICRSVTSPSTSDSRLVTVVQERGRKTIIDSSIRRGDGDLTQYMACIPRIVNVHESCRILYNSERQCELHKRKSSCVVPDPSESKVKVLRSSIEEFDWKQDCFLCTKPAAFDPRNQSR